MKTEKNIFTAEKHAGSKTPGRLPFCLMAVWVFFFSFLFSAADLSGTAFSQRKDLKEPCEILTQNNDCEAPALRQRLGQQLRLNVRNSRPGYQYNLSRNNQFSASILPEQLQISGGPCFIIGAPYEEVSTYPAYSRYALPVRAGPRFALTEQFS